MPAATTHVEFARDVYRILPGDLKEKVTNMHMFWLGSQGPDMLFFSRISLLPGSLKKYGNLMHAAKVPEVIAFFEKYRDDPDLNSYFMGFLCHYALDSIAHPLIFAMAKAIHKETGDHEGTTHVTLEAHIDIWMLHQRGRSIYDYDVHKYLRVSASDRKKLGKMYSAMFKEVYGLDISAFDCAMAAFETGTLTAVLYPNKYSHAAIYKLEDLLKLPHSFSGMILYGKNDSRILNLEHKPYPLHFDPSQSISASFPELYGKAALLAVKLLRSHTAEDFRLNFEGVPQEKMN